MNALAFSLAPLAVLAGILVAGCARPDHAEVALNTLAPAPPPAAPVHPVRRRPPRAPAETRVATIRIELDCIDGRSALAVDGKNLGLLPEAGAALAAQLGSLDSDPAATIAVLAFHPRVPQEHVEMVVTACTAARLTRLRLAHPAEPARPEGG
ncbi:MAG: hypothetical protein JXQ29_07225 [Planctomycetes bacterium]|nr:hypothetical protein [Planctomycetota bacterium]